MIGMVVKLERDMQQMMVNTMIYQLLTWLPDKTKAYPEYNVAGTRSSIFFVNKLRQENEWYLAHHCHEGVNSDHMAGYANQELMHYSGDKEDNKCCPRLRKSDSDAVTLYRFDKAREVIQVRHSCHTVNKLTLESTHVER